MTDAVKEAITAYEDDFDIEHVDTTAAASVQASNIPLAQKILDRLDSFLDPNVLVVPRQQIEALPLDGAGGNFDNEQLVAALSCIKEHGRFVPRDEAERDDKLVQIVACGVLTRDSEVFVFQRRDKDPKSSLYGKSTIWQGTHVSSQPEKLGLELLETALMERITESLHLSRAFRLEARGYCWDKENPKSAMHFGVIFFVEIDNPNTAIDLRKKEFRKWQGRGHPLSGSFLPWSELKRDADALELESWSRAIIANGDQFAGRKKS
jgi:predicted NUDIX family phosphoesterase